MPEGVGSSSCNVQAALGGAFAILSCRPQIRMESLCQLPHVVPLVGLGNAVFIQRAIITSSWSHPSTPKWFAFYKVHWKKGIPEWAHESIFFSTLTVTKHSYLSIVCFKRGVCVWQNQEDNVLLSHLGVHPTQIYFSITNMRSVKILFISDHSKH